MKDSGVEWIGDIPEGWTCEKLKFRAEVNAQQLASTTASDYYFDYVDISSVTYGKGIIATERMTFQSSPSRARRVVQENDIIIGTVRTYLKAIAKIPSFSTPIIASTGFAVIRPSRISCQFLYYVVQSDSFIYPIISHSDGVSYPSISENKIFNIKIPIPSEIEQQRIADFLDTRTADIDASIAKTQESIEEYKKLKQAVITQAVTKGIRPGRVMKDSGVEWIGEIPEEWMAAPVKYYFRLQTGTTPSSQHPEYFGGVIPWYTPGDILDKIELISSERTLKQEALDDGVVPFYPQDSVLIVGIGATLGKTGYLDHPASSNQQITALIPRTDNVFGLYTAYCFKSMEEKLKDFAFYTTLPIINNRTLGQFKCPFPPLSEQREIAAYLDEKCAAIDTLIEKKQAIITELEAYKKSLIYEYVTGKKEVPVASC